MALSDDAYDRLRSAIRDGAFAPGQHMKLRDIAASFDMSITPVREGLARLVAERILQALPNRTICVPKPSAQTMIEVRRIRCELEGLAAFEAAAQITAGELERIKGHQAEFARASSVNDTTAMRQANSALHFAIYEAARMPILYETISSFWLRDGPVQNLMYAEAGDEVRGANKHEELIDRLWARDSQGARTALVADISEVTQVMLRLLEESR